MKTPSIATLRLQVCTVLFVVAIALAGCAGTRPPQTQAQLLQLREATDQRLVMDGRAMFQQLLAQVKGDYDAYSAGRAPAPPQIDILIISGGGDWGAFGAGNDGVVAYESAHLDGVASEKVVHSSHSTQSEPETIQEVRRILRAHVTGTTGKPGTPVAPGR
jgi:hypothetical protein